MVTYVNKKGIKSFYPFAKAFESKNGEMARRLKYTKEILTYINKKNSKYWKYWKYNILTNLQIKNLIVQE